MSKKILIHFLLILTFLATFFLTGCASTHPANPQDPYENYNRKIFKFNRAVDKVVFRPAAKTYDTLTPTLVRRGIRNFLSNVGEVPTIANDILQANIKWAVFDTGRLIINSILGVGGLFEVAAPKFGLEKHNQDFGLTLARWGYTNSPYLLVPLLPPGTTRDLISLAPDYYMSVWAYVEPDWVGYAAFGVTFLDRRALLLSTDKLVDEAFDPYVFVRDAYLQNRRAQINRVMNPDTGKVEFSEVLTETNQ